MTDQPINRRLFDKRTQNICHSLSTSQTVRIKRFSSKQQLCGRSAGPARQWME